MKENRKELKEKILENLEFIGLGIIILFLIIGDKIGIGNIQKNFPSIIGAFLITFTIHTIRESLRRRKQSERLRAIEEMLERNLETHAIEFIDPKSLNFWSNFEGVFYGWNPLFRMEQEGNRDDWYLSHKTRYKSSKFMKAKYIVFREQDDKSGGNKKKQTSYKRFLRHIMALSQDKKFPEEKIDIYIVDESTLYTFFIFQKEASELCALYIHEQPFMKGDMPQRAFLIKDETIIEAFKGMFEEKISNMEPLSLNEVLKDIDGDGGYEF